MKAAVVDLGDVGFGLAEYVDSRVAGEERARDSRTLVVSRADVMRAFVRPDADIVAEIRDGVLKKVMWVDPRRVSVTCEDGNLILIGNMETRSDAELLVELAKRVDGVASVEDRLTWEIDNAKLEMTGPPPIRTSSGTF